MAGLVGMAEVTELLGTSRQRAQEIIERRKPPFPTPLAVLKAGRIWDRDEVVAWIAANRPARDEG